MGVNGANFIFRGTGGKSPFGTSYVSGSHCGNNDYWRTYSGGHKTTINITEKNYNTGCGGFGYGVGMYNNGGLFGYNSLGMGMYGGGTYGMGMYGAGCYGGGYGGCGGGLSSGAAWTAFGVGAGIGLLASPLGGPIIRGIGTGFKYAGIGIGKAATWTWNTLLKPAGVGIWNGMKAVGSGVGEFFTRCWNACTGKGWTK